VASGDNLSVNYTGWLQDTGKLFDSSLNPGRTPFQITIGVGRVIKGWDEGLIGMKVGEMRRLIIPPALAYGATGSGPVPANATLVFDIQMLSISTSTPTATP
jgi:FKBP-type peptidyl-prolyl cis-trans isomerase